MHVRFTTVFLLGSVLVLVGCSAGKGRPGNVRVRDDGVVDSGSLAQRNLDGGGSFRDPVARAQLRERALTVLASAAVTGSAEERANAIEGMTAAPTRLAPVLDRALVDENVAVRSVAAIAAGRTANVDAIPQLHKLARDPSPHVQASALYALKALGQTVDLSPLASMLADSSPRVRAHAVYVLGEIGEPSALPLLREASRKDVARADRAEVRIMDLQFAEARVKLGEEAPLQELRAALFPARPEDLEGTALACQILGQLRDRASVNRLIELVRPQSEKNELMPAEVRLAAAGALAKLGQPHGAYIADQYRPSSREPLRMQAALVYGDIGAIANLPLLADMMNDPAGRVRVAAATAIIRVTEADAALPGTAAR